MTLFLHILITEVSKSDGPRHHSEKEDCACGFCQTFSVTDQVPLTKQITEKKQLHYLIKYLSFHI